MSGRGTYRTLESAVNKLNDHIRSTKNSPYLTGVVGPQPQLPVARHISALEAMLRRESHENFQKLLHFRVVDPHVMGNFLKSLYSMRNTLGVLDSSAQTTHLVHHEQLFNRYNALPHPGVAHMGYRDFEHFMSLMFSYRAFLKPNLLSGTNIHFFNDTFILKQYAAGHSLRQAHLETLWRITDDLASAKIPTTDHEQRNLVYKTFFRDRPDIMQKVQRVVERGLAPDAEHEIATFKQMQGPDFDLDTYREVLLRFGNAADPETLNVLLFTALRHNNGAVYSEIIAQFAPQSFTRDTFKILLENLGYLGKHEAYTRFLAILASDFLELVDIRLLNIVVLSLVNLGEPDLARSMVDLLSAESKQLAEKDQFLKLIKFEDKRVYSLYIAAYDQLDEKPPVCHHPTEQTFLPLLVHYCKKGASFETISGVLAQAESTSSLPLTSQMFKHIFLAFTKHNYPANDLQYMLSKLIEAHDLNSGSRDTWIREQINDSMLPRELSIVLNEIMAEPSSAQYSTQDNNFIKLSNGLVRQVFQAFYHTLGHSDISEYARAIEAQLHESMQMAQTRHETRIGRDALQAVDLHEREELVYLKKTSLLQLLDIFPVS